MQKSLILVFTFIYQLSANSQSIFQRIERNVGLLKYSFTDSNKVFTGSGTGTLIFKPLDSTENYGYIFIITNRHVLPKFVQSKSIDFYISNIDSSDTPYSKLTIPIYQANGNFDPHVKVSTIEDLAIIEISRLITSPVSKIKFIGIDNFATKEVIKSLVYNIGDIVFFIGYPNLFYSRNNYSPIFRTGYISSNPLKTFYFPPLLKQLFKQDSLNGFLIDANAFAGSSGSLVFSYPTLLDPEFYKDGHAMTTNKKANTWILGVLTESYYTNGQNEYHQRINIGGVISSDRVLDLISTYTYRDH